MGRYFKEHKLLVAATVVFCIAIGVIQAGIAVLIQRVLDMALAGEAEQFIRALLFAVVYFAVMGLTLYLATLLGFKTALRVLKSMRRAVFAGVMRQNMEEFYSVNTADYLSALNNDMKIIEENYLNHIFDIVYHAVLFVASLIVMFYFDVFVTLVVIGISVLMMVIPGIIGVALQKRQVVQSEKLSAFMARTKDFFSGFEIIRTYRMSLFTKKSFEAKNDELFTAQYRVGKLAAALAGVTATLALLTSVAAIFLSAHFILIGRITAGVLLGLVQASGQLVSPIGAILGIFPMIQGAKPIIERINRFADHAPTGFVGTQAPTFETGITVSNLHFGYTEEDTTLQDVSVAFERGKKYAIIGGSGCGKSTLVKLLTGYYSKYEGEIAYDGVDLHQLDMEKLGELSATIHQNIYLFDETIQDNICLHRDYSEDELQRTLAISGVDLFLSAGGKDLSDPVGENGANLSGGQRQRIAVARALILNKPLLILDEGTSSLDLQTAYDIESRLLKEDALTLVTITHALNPELLQAYDRIIFMKDGAIAETGTYTELMQKNGMFATYSNVAGA
ncbi:MAG: ABC transporter ATP-binding protein/permease [Oscillospiraceae bacterium]|nr:ABC transporter ATP-binding protein/permease [Oscillospiraceae bacterium]